MAVNLSPVFGVAGQVFDNNGNPLAGGKIFTYLAGTTTNATTYTSSNGAIAHSNPIILDGAGRVPSGEIWLTDGITYKFVVQDSANNLIGTYDNLTGINSNFVAFTNSQEIQTATAGQTVFNLATMQYQVGTNSLSVFVDGVNQYGPGAQYAYVETDDNTVTFVSGLHVGASVKFTTSQLNSSGAADASQVTYDPPFVGAVATNVEAKLAQTVSVVDFGAVGDGVTDDYQAFQDAIDALPVSGGTILIPATTSNTWVISQTLNVRKKLHLIGQVAYGTGDEKGTRLIFPAGVTGIILNAANTSLFTTVPLDPLLPGAFGSILENIFILGGGGATADGVVLRCTSECRQVCVRGFSRYGFRIYTSIGAGGYIEGQADGWKLDNCQAVANGSHGFFTDGNNGNVGVAIRCASIVNGGYGFWENTLIGSTYLGCNAEGNTTGSVHADRSSSSATFIGQWEDGASTSVYGIGVVAYGGNCGNPDSSSVGSAFFSGISRNVPMKYLNNKGSEQVGSAFGWNDTTQSVFAFGANSETPTLDAWRLKFDSAQNVWFIQFANSSSFQPIAYPNSAGALWTQKNFSGAIFQNGYAVKNSGDAYSAAKVRMLGSAAPTTNTWAVGDIVYNDTPTAGGFIGWVCVTAGTPGTWKTFGPISV